MISTSRIPGFTKDSSTGRWEGGSLGITHECVGFDDDVRAVEVERPVDQFRVRVRCPRCGDERWIDGLYAPLLEVDS